MAKVYNISLGKSFADNFVKGLLDRVADDPLALSKYLLLLPSRRACRTIADAFLRISEGKPILLPQMQPIGDVDAEELILSNLDDVEELPAISKLERQLLLAQLIQKTDDSKSFDQSVQVALELAHFLDEIQTERLNFADLEKIVPDEFAEHWQKVLDFLKILTNFWPQILKERGYIDIAERRNSLIEARIKAWQDNPPDRNIIAVGSIGPIPAAAELIALIAKLPKGEVILPAVDMLLDDDAWQKIAADSPQYMIKNLLNKIGIKRSEIQEWYKADDDKINHQRVKLISEAMRPAESTDNWRLLKITDISEHALAGISRIDCQTSQQEAETIALIMREVLETPEKTCALVTSDRRMARRVSQCLKRWGIVIDDSGGQPLTEFSVGSYFLSLAKTAVENLAPISLLAFLKHPLTAFAIEGAELRDNIQFLDEKILRGVKHSGGFNGIKENLDTRVSENFITWLDLLESNLKEFLSVMISSEKQNFKSLLQLHIKTAEQIASTTDMIGANRLWRGDVGDAAAKFLTDLLTIADNIPDLLPSDYVAVLSVLLKSNTVRPKFGTHPRLSILGQIESRLYCADMVILGGLNEDIWPKLSGDDAWMSRPMRKQFGLPSPEKEIGLSAHDFAQLACAKEVILTRACKIDGVPTVPTRWLLRIETVLNALGLSMDKSKEYRYKKLLELLDRPNKIEAISRPMPIPPLQARPQQLSVTNIEKLMRDPYQIYAKYILKLKPLDNLEEEAGGAEKGKFIHAALENFVKEVAGKLPPNAKEKLLQFGEQALIADKISDEIKAYWWPRFSYAAEIFINQEKQHRLNALPIMTENTGQIKLNNGFTITAKVDRIDKTNDGEYIIFDYKTGNIPSRPDIKAGLSPQLTLAAVILEQNGFYNISNAKVKDLIYWKLSGGGTKPVGIEVVNNKKTNIDDLISSAKEGIEALTNYFYQPQSAYISYPRDASKIGYTDYEHLSRIKEWGILGDD